VLVDAFDNKAEFEACLRSTQANIDRRAAAGEPVDRNEHASGTVYEPGHRQRAANGRLLTRALRHGVRPGPWMDQLELPRNIAVLRSEDGPGPSRRGWKKRVRRLIPRWLARARLP
jgi:hypothetical protein